jgi:hypothetical protein
MLRALLGSFTVQAKRGSTRLPLSPPPPMAIVHLSIISPPSVIHDKGNLRNIPVCGKICEPKKLH